MIRVSLWFGLLLLVSACTWVKPTESGQTVQVMDSVDTESCKPVGKITSVSRAKLAGIKRKEKKLETELETIARNEAVDLGGNVVVPKGDISGDEQEFLVYHCQ